VASQGTRGRAPRREANSIGVYLGGEPISDGGVAKHQFKENREVPLALGRS
jgi:hypothetical protein